MKKASFTNIAVFILFFGIALTEAIRNGHLLEALLFVAVGILALLADFRRK